MCLASAKLLLFCDGLPLNLTARQYGEVVLPDAASGQGLGALARKLSRYKVYKWPGNDPGAEIR